MKWLLVLLSTLPIFGQTCTPLSAPISGIDNVFPAVTNGIDGVKWSIARIQWTCTADSTQRRIQYATAAEWAATGPFSPSQSITYPHVTAQQGVPGQPIPTTAGNITGGIVSNLKPSTLYHVLSASFIGSSWVNTTDQTFTTAARPAGKIIKPQLPISVDTTRPTMTGTHWLYGGPTAGGFTACGTTSGTGYSITTANMQDCFDDMHQGDDLSLPFINPNSGTNIYLITQASFHNSENAVSITCSSSTSFCDNGGTAPTNGTKVVMGSSFFGTTPSPMNPGLPYYVVSSGMGAGGAGTFQLSTTLSGTPITLLNAGSSPAYILYSFVQPGSGTFQPKMVIHSTAAANLLPPVNVRLGNNSLLQYLPNMPILVAVDPLLGAGGRGYIQYAPMTENLVWENVGFNVDGTVATSNTNNSHADPQAFPSPIQLTISNNNIGYDQCAYLHPGAPTRVASVTWNGINNYFINGYSALDWWQPHYSVPSGVVMSISGNVITIPASVLSYVGASGTKVSCSIPAGTVTISGGGTGSLYLWTNTDCTQGGSLTTGITASTTITGLTINNASTPAYPTYTYTSPTSITQVNKSVIPFSYVFTITSGTITSTNTDISKNWSDIGQSSQRNEGSSGFEIAGYGPFKFDNNYIQGEGIGGIFWADDLTLGGTPCVSNPCTVQTIIGNLTVTRNTITTDAAHFFYSSTTWDGGNRYWRNANEQKAGRFSLWDGNIVGPWSAQVGEGQCALHEEFENLFIQVGSYPGYADASDWTFINNTCINMPTTGITTSYSFQSPWIFGYPMSNLLIQNNLFYLNNAYAQVSANQPFRSDGHVVPDPTDGQCPQGQLLYLTQIENLEYDHNTDYGRGGCQSFIAYFANDYPSLSITNSVINLVNDPGPFSAALSSGVFFAATGYLGGGCSTATGAANIFNCINNFTWAGNILLYTWTNSLPGSQTDFNSSDITSNQANWSGYSSLLPTGNTLSLRTLFGKWFNLSAGDARYSASSPYVISAIDGLAVGVDMDQLQQHQGLVSNIRVLSSTSTSMKLGFHGPNSFACGVDWGTTAFYNGTGSWTRVTGAAGSVDPREQAVNVTGLPADSLIYYRLNCEVMQPTNTYQLP